jgi:CHAT domain-containing protein/tetratricopeptide (TPR) repeat protein
MNVLPLLPLLAALVQADVVNGPERLRVLARDGPQAVLIQEVQDHPDDVRDALRQLLVMATTTVDSAATLPLAAADRLAAAYAVAWHDPFLIRQVSRFRRWRPADRHRKVMADSLRLAGNDALGRDGVAVAVRLWRESARRAAAIGDTSAIAAALGNIGRGFYEESELDSAEAYWSRSADLARRISDFRTAGNAVGNLASVKKDRGELRQAESLYVEAGAIRRRSGDARGLAADENNRGLIAQTLGDFAGARNAFETALAANHRTGRREPEAVNLLNLGNLGAMSGEYDAADMRYHEALTAYRAAGNRVGVAETWHDIGLLRLTRGDYAGATAALLVALRIFEVTGPATEIAAVHGDIADVRAATGDLQGARRELQRAETTVRHGGEGDRGLRARLALTRGDLAVLLNAPADADRAYTEAQELYRRANDGSGEAEAFQGRGYLFLLREEYTQARDVLEQALRGQESSDLRSRALTRLLVGYALRESGDTAEARRAVTTALDTLRAVDDAAGEAAALGSLAALAARSGTGLTAESLYRRGLERLESAPAPSVSWQLHAGLGEALRSRGALTDAVTELHAAAADVERVAARLPLEQRRASYLEDKWEVYAELALAERTRGRIEAAFAASERLRARQMLDLLARGRIVWTASSQDSLRSREQDLRLRISELTRRLEDARAVGGLREPAVGMAAAVREALTRAQTAYAELLAAIQEARPEYARLVEGKGATLREVANQLGADEALLEYLVTDSTTLVFVVTSDTAVVLDLGIGRHTLASLVDFTRGALTRPARGAAADGPSWRAPLERLYRYLIEPIEAAGLLRGKRALVFAPHVELHYLPFAALRRPGDSPSFLVERYVVTTVPSASVWLRLRERSDVAPGAGVLALAPRADVLPGTRIEVGSVARLNGSRTRVLLGARATKRALRAIASEQRIIHFATYGVLNKHNPLFSFVELAPGGGEDGRLEVHEVFNLDLHARLVVLSACQTALGAGALSDVPAGDDWVGLVEGFLYAGAANVMATLWPVEDRATAGLMERFYTEFAAGRPEAEALASAQRQALRNSATADPFYWAGFTLNGGR